MVPSVSFSAWTVPLREGSQNESRPNDYVAQITDAFAARRMDATVKAALSGRRLNEIEDN